MRSLREDTQAMVDLGLVLMIGVAFVALVLVAYIVWELRGITASLGTPADTAGFTPLYNTTFNTTKNITVGFDNAIALILVAITIFILAVAISALLVMRRK